MYTGEYRVQLDDKMRVHIPSKFRMQLGDTLMVCAGTDGCCLLMTEQELSLLLSEIASNTKLGDFEKQNALRVFNSYVFQLKEDAQGRCVLPAKISGLIKAEKNTELVFLGVTNRIEIWTRSVYDKKFNTEDIDLNSVVFGVLGI